MNKVVTFIMVMFLCSCNTGIECVIHNDSSKKINTVKISTSDSKASIVLNNIETHTTKKDFLNMNNVNRMDGSYSIRIEQDKKYKSENFGYYTNGSPVGEKIDIYISNDTVIFEETF